MLSRSRKDPTTPGRKAPLRRRLIKKSVAGKPGPKRASRSPLPGRFPEVCNQTFAAADYQNAVQMGDQLYILSDGKVYPTYS